MLPDGDICPNYFSLRNDKIIEIDMTEYSEERNLNMPKLKTTGLYYAGFVALGFSIASLGPTLPGLAQNAQTSLSAIGILFTARSLGSLIGSVAGGRIFDRLRGHSIIAASFLCIAIMTALTPFSSTLWLLAALLFVTGIAQGMLNVGGNTLLMWLHGRGVGPFMNALHFFFGLGTVMIPVIIAQFVERQDGIIWIYLFLAVVVLVPTVVAFLPSPTAAVVSHRQEETRRDALLILLISLVFGCYQGATISFSGWIFTYVTRLDLVNETNAAYLTSVYWGALTLGRLAAIPISIRYEPIQILRADFTGALISLLPMLLWPESLTAVIITSAGLGFTLASIYPTTMTFAERIMPISGGVVGLFAVGNYVGSMLVPWIIGFLIESAPPWSMTVVLMIDMLIALVVLVFLVRRNTFLSTQNLPAENLLPKI